MATVASGHIERLPSGSLRVRVYGGRDPVTGGMDRDSALAYLTEFVAEQSRPTP